jgi:hypothetical protein
VQQYEPGYYYREQPRAYGYREPAWGGHRAAPYGYGYQRHPAYVDQGYGRGYAQPRRAAPVQQHYRSGGHAQPHYSAPGGFNPNRPRAGYGGNENGGSGSN